MGLAIREEPLPLVTDTGGSVRIGGTRVTLDTVVKAFTEGSDRSLLLQDAPEE